MAGPQRDQLEERGRRRPRARGAGFPWLWLAAFASLTGLASAAAPYYRITVTDDQTGRGIPWVKLTLADSDEFWTDSAGVVAFLRPDLMDKWVTFTVESYGYTIPPDAQGKPRVRLFATTGGTGGISMHRVNIAERLYRITGVDIYADSVILGDSVPPTADVSPQPAVGMDSAQTIEFKNKIYWIWGDTGVARYPLGNFRSTGAVSDPPDLGGLNPDVGVSLTYFRNADGSVKAMANLTNSGPIWLGGFMVVKDVSDQEHLVISYSKIQGYLTAVETGLVQFNETTKVFDFLCLFPLDSVILPGGSPFHHTEKGMNYIYSCNPYPNVRVPDDYASIQNLAEYEGFSCLKPGSVYEGTAGQLDRDGQGNLVWGWKQNTSPINETQTRQLIQKGYMRADEDWYKVLDINGGASIQSHNGSVCWSPYRKRWISIRSQVFGQTFLGEIYYLEGDTPLGPWIYAQKVVTNYLSSSSAYTFYNPVQHPEFDQSSGRVIYFEGTVTAEWANLDHPTPEYNYNQMMYKVDLDDPRLFLPVPVYRVEGTIPYYATKNDIPDDTTTRTIVCLAPDRPRAGTIPIYARTDAAHGTTVLENNDAAGSATIAFYAVSAGAPPPPGTDLALTVPLNEFVNATTGQRIYTTADAIDDPGYTKSAQPVCRVWPYPIKFNPYALPN